jgi:hypothetical protein
MKTLQETFNELLIHMRALGGKQAHDGTQCLYRTENGEAGCPVGHLIPTSSYNSSLEGLPSIASQIQSILYEEGYDPLFCYIFQLIHDKMSPDRWEECAYLLAKDLGLKYFAPEGYTIMEGIEALDSYDVVGIHGYVEEVWKERTLHWKILAKAQRQAAEKLGVTFVNV